MVRASDVEIKEVEWLWYPLIPRAMETIKFGPGGVGKSTFAVDLTARITTGAPMPGELAQRAPANVVYVTTEDAYDRVVVPRLVNAGADLSRITFIKRSLDADGHPVPMKIPTDVEQVAELITGEAAALLVVDPVTAYIDSGVDTHRATDLRDALLPLQDMLHEVNAAGVLIAHPNKDERQSALHRLSGSHAWVDSARSVIGVAPRRDTEGQVLVKQLKANLAPDVPAYAFQLVQGEQYPAHMRVEWLSERVFIDRDDLLRKPDARRASPDREQAERLLGELLDERGGMIAAKAAIAEAKLAGISETTMKRAREQLGVKSERVRDERGQTKEWVWYRTNWDPARLGWEGLRALGSLASDDGT